MAKRATLRQDLVTRSEKLIEALNDACAVLGVTGIAGLSAAVDRLAARHQHEDERTRLRRELHEIADTLDEESLRREREGVNLDLLPSEIEREELRQKQLFESVTEASAAHHQAQIDLEALTKGCNAATASVERAEANAELLSIAERWLLRAAACRLAARVIERHRVIVQDPLIAEAGKLFAAATDNAFADLGIDYGDDDQPILVARRTNGERVRVEGLSEGTRDQLFLALRLALLERRPSEPVPFIGDDLMTSFDERRTLATLRLLASAGQRRQIILFTHHRHVADLAKSIQNHVVDFVDL
jgi:uncharacterized protein YhaN